MLPVHPRVLWGTVVINGNNWVGETLTADTAKLGGSGAIAYQWKRGDSAVGDNSPAYTIETDDAGEGITVTVSRADNSGTITSNAIAAVLQPLSGATVPVTGVNKIGGTLSVDTGGIAGGSGTLGFQWQADGIDIPGASAVSYTIKAQDVSTILRCVITRPDASGDLVTQGLKVPYTVTIAYALSSPPAIGDSVTADRDTFYAADTITLRYTVADTRHYNTLDFRGISTAVIAPVSGAGSGVRTYTVNPADAENGEIIIEAAFEHTDLIPDPIAFNDTTAHLFLTYGDALTNAVSPAHSGSGALSYSSSDTDVASVNDSGTVTAYRVGTTIISAEKYSDAVYAPASRSYTLTVNPRPLIITPHTGQSKVYGAPDPAFAYTASETLIAGNGFAGSLSRVQGEHSGTYPFTLGSLCVLSDTGAQSNYTLALDTGVYLSITRAPGADAAAPAASGAQASGDTIGTITIGAVTLPNNPGAQTPEYAMSALPNADPAYLAWQPATTFPGLDAGTAYYAYVRAAQNADYEAGTASVSAAIMFYHVVFDGNGSDSGAVPAQAAFSGEDIAIPGRGSLARSGFNFICWNSAADATGSNFAAGDSYTVLASHATGGIIRLYARWMGAQRFPFDVQDIVNNDPHITNNGGIILSHSNSALAVAILEVSGAYDNIQWYYDGASLGSGPQFTLDVTNYLYNQPGMHHIEIIATLNGVPMSSNIPFTVVE